jgi:hypothetical protein
MADTATGLPGDIPMVCTRSGIVVVLDMIVPTERDDPKLTAAGVSAIVRERGTEARVRGRLCASCRTQPSVAWCEYRPLRGPLFVPR